MAPKGHHGNIPIVDLGKLNVFNKEKIDEEEWKRVGKEISSAFSNIGFVYLTNHGIPESVIKQNENVAKVFFDKPAEIKDKYPRTHELQHGYVAINREKLSTDSMRHELRESYDVRLLDGKFPDKDVPEFKPSVTSLVDNCLKLTKNLLTALEFGLDWPNGFLTNTHRLLMSDKNATCLRVLHYPAIPKNIDAGAIRCGAHTDYGTITLLFQDDMGGLEVRDRNGRWVAADPLQGAVLVNVGDILQMWTDDLFIATEHRVLIPEAEIKKRSPRRSAVFFIHPDDDVLITPPNGSKKKSNVTAKQHVDKRFRETYQY